MNDCILKFKIKIKLNLDFENFIFFEKFYLNIFKMLKL